MPFYSQIKERIKTEDFIEKINFYNRDNIVCTNHTFDRLSEKQIECLNCEKLKEYLLTKEPILIGIQYNGAHTVYYKHENKKGRFIRIILDIRIEKINIITFYITNKIPVIK